MKRHFAKRVLLLASFLAVPLSGAYAATYTVDRTDDTAAATGCSDATPNDCSLRGAVIKANADAAPDEIILPASTTPYMVTIPRGAEGNTAGDLDPTVGDIDITQPLKITGAGADQVTITASGTNDRVFMANLGGTGSVEISGVTITGGNAGFRGGAVWAFNSALVMNNCNITGNAAAAEGGGISADNASGTNLTMTNTTVSNNTAAGNGGGGLFYETGNASIVNSTFSGNTVTTASPGGGIHIFTATGPGVVLINDTIVNNSTAAGGSGGGLVRGMLGTVTVKNSILANNNVGGAPQNCGGTITSGGHNISSDASCVADFTGAGDQNSVAGTIVDATLANNGGPTPTHTLPDGSPAIDLVPLADCLDATGAPLANDQRGFKRPADGNGDGTPLCDAGAVEVGCGNGHLDSGEECDDGNNTDGDGCSAVCTLEAGGTSAGTGSTTAGTTTSGSSKSGGCSLIR